MAQQSEFNPLHDIRSLTWSPLPTLRYTKGHSTVNESVSVFMMTADQLLGWRDFEASVRATTNICLGLQTRFIPTQTEKEVVHIGNEQGLMGRFGQNVSHVMSEVYECCHLPIFFADCQAGKTHVDAQSYRKIPDLVLMDDQRLVRAVGEGKTFWTRDLTKKDPTIRATWFGQLARYMDDLKLRYGFYTTYNATIFLRRTSDTTFEESPPILHCTPSTDCSGEGSVSVRECFLYLAKLVSSDLYEYPKTYGKDLTDGSLVQRERSSQRLEEAMAKLKLPTSSRNED
ncbi:hypothetical protein FGG08_003146 [Glutinoglossum americanum]|uniref:Uncharacterized protein n=1 Tax=Glutinoglossum americanum TaxID=1670608 RepID=A0A9P8I7X2_9PEZI|nr:hypothetical protein FGG08_003146 [Glutinoglossum americanum]